MCSCCHSILGLRCERDLFLAFLRRYRGREFDVAVLCLDRIDPTPLTLCSKPGDTTAGGDELRKHGTRDCIIWRLAHWGVPWSPRILNVVESEQALVLHSAWNPPIAALSKMAGQHPEIGFELIYAHQGAAGRVAFAPEQDSFSHIPISHEEYALLEEDVELACAMPSPGEDASRV